MASKGCFLRTPIPFPTSPTSLPTVPPPKLKPSFLPLRPPHGPPFPIRSLRSPCEDHSQDAIDPCEDSQSQDTVVERLLSNPSKVRALMKMQRRPDPASPAAGRWFPYLDSFCVGPAAHLTSCEVLDALGGYILDARRERMRWAVAGRSYAVSLVVEGLSDYGNVSAAFRSADALGVQSVHVISLDINKRYRKNRHVSRGAEKWLDIELWSSPAECFAALGSRGYRIAATHLGGDTVSIYDMDWTTPLALVVGNEHMGISDEALSLSDLHCHIPMNGMVGSFNVSVAAGILMHHAVSQRLQHFGSHGDLTPEERQILLAEFCLRHGEGSIGVVKRYAKQKMEEIASNSSILEGIISQQLNEE